MSRTIRNTRHAKFYRVPRTFGERKAVLAALEDGVRVRPKRNVKHLPNDYDDKIVGAKYEEIEEKS